MKTNLTKSILLATTLLTASLYTQPSFVRRFPVYKEGDANCCPEGGIRQLQYKLVPGEATWQLKLVKSTDF